MLVLSRKKNEEIVIEIPPSQISKRVFVTIVRANPGNVRVGISADRDVSVNRGEIQKHVDAGRARKSG